MPSRCFQYSPARSQAGQLGPHPQSDWPQPDGPSQASFSHTHCSCVWGLASSLVVDRTGRPRRGPCRPFSSKAHLVGPLWFTRPQHARTPSHPPRPVYPAPLLSSFSACVVGILMPGWACSWWQDLQTVELYL